MPSFPMLDASLNGGQAEPRKSDSLLQPQANQAPQQGADAGQATTQTAPPAQATGIATDSGNGTSANAAAQQVQKVQSPQAVIDLNKDVGIKTDATSKAVDNANAIAANQVATAQSYQPKAVDRLSSVKNYLTSGVDDGNALQAVNTDTAFQKLNPLDYSQIANDSQQLATDPAAGLNRLDRLIAAKNPTFMADVNNAESQLAAKANEIRGAQTDADSRYQAAVDGTKASEAAVNPFLQSASAQRAAELDQLKAGLSAKQQAEMAARDEQAHQAQMAARNVLMGGVNSAPWMAPQYYGNASNMNGNLPITNRNIDTMPQSALQETPDSIAKRTAVLNAVQSALNNVGTGSYLHQTPLQFDPNAYLTADQFAQNNRLSQLLGESQLASQAQQVSDLAPGTFDQAAYKQALADAIEQSLPANIGKSNPGDPNGYFRKLLG